MLQRLQISSVPAAGRVRPPGRGWHFFQRYPTTARSPLPDPLPGRIDPSQPARTARDQKTTELAQFVPVGTQPGLIVARCELGASHAVFIRGEGGELSWHGGERLQCIEPGVWAWFAGATRGRITFQLLLNDLVWARGEKLILEAGQRLDLAPDFEWPEIPRTTAAPQIPARTSLQA